MNKVNMTAKRRLLDYLYIKKISKTDFYRKTGLSNGFLDKSDNINSDKIHKIVASYKDLSLKWLITGEGDMLNNPTAEQDKHEAEVKTDTFRSLSKAIEDLTDEIRMVSAELRSATTESKKPDQEILVSAQQD